MFPDPGRVVGLWISVLAMTAEAQSVMTMRMMGMAGLWPVPRSEANRMVIEKVEAWNDLVRAGTVTAFGSPLDAMEAAVKPYRRRTRANARRLGRMPAKGR